MTKPELERLVTIYQGDPWHVRPLLKEFIAKAVITKNEREPTPKATKSTTT